MLWDSQELSAFSTVRRSARQPGKPDLEFMLWVWVERRIRRLWFSGTGPVQRMYNAVGQLDTDKWITRPTAVR